MNRPTPLHRALIVTCAAGLFLSACSPSPVKPQGADDLRSRLTRLQSDPQLASLAPVALKEAESAVIAAEQPQEDRVLGQHLVVIAERKLDIATARSQTQFLTDQRAMLIQQRETARLESRTLEAGMARSDAKAARADAATARAETDAARMDTDAARQQAEELQRQIAALNARETDRGLVVTLGDVLFATGKADLKGGAVADLAKLAAFLTRYPDRTIAIEGHTDSVGGEDYNLALSQRRAESVKSYLVGQGIASTRVDASGKGEGSPVSGNDSATGRQQNRRVEVIIANATVSVR